MSPPAGTARGDRVPALAEPLPAFDDALRRTAAAADDAPFTVAGRRAIAIGRAAHGVDAVRLDTLHALGALRVEGAEPANIAITPVGVERTLRLGGRTVVERLVVALDAPAAVVEWHVPDDAGAGDEGAASGAVEIAIAWTAPLRSAGRHDAPLVWRREESTLRLAADEDGRRVLFALSRAPERWNIRPPRGPAVGSAPASTAPTNRPHAGSAPASAAPADGPHARATAAASALDVRVALRLAPGESVRLACVATAEGDDGLTRALAALRRPATLVRARAAAARALRRRTLSVVAPDPRLGDAVAWAKFRLHPFVTGSAAAGTAPVASYGGAVARADDGEAYAAEDAIHAVDAALAAGDAGPARDALRWLGRHADAAGRPPSARAVDGTARYDGPDPTPLYLLLAARYAAWTGDLGLVLAEWPRIEAALGRWAAQRPDAPGAAADPGAGDPASEPDAPGGARGPDSALARAALAALARTAESLGRDDAADALRELAGPNADPELAVELAGRDAPAGHVVARLVYGLLGAAPDAPRGRLRLRPRLPADWDRFTAERLRVGDAEVALRYRRDGRRHEFRLEQTAGAVPLRVVFEPALPGARLERARVDGEPADLEARRSDDRVIAPLQVVLDHERAIALETTAPDAPG